MVHQRQPRHEKVLLWAHIRVNFVLLVMPIMHALCYLKPLLCGPIAPASLALELAIEVQLNVGGLQSVLFQEFALILGKLFSDQLFQQ